MMVKLSPGPLLNNVPEGASVVQKGYQYLLLMLMSPLLKWQYDNRKSALGCLSSNKNDYLMDLKKLIAQERGLLQNHEFKGHLLFSLGQQGTSRPDRFGTVIVFNDDELFPGSEIGMHPHQHTEIITYMIEGQESHRDSLGNYQELSAGDIQVISSGSGIMHAGGNMSSVANARHLQIWIVPNGEPSAPSLQLKTKDEGNGKNKWELLISPNGEDNSLIVKQAAWISQGSWSEGSVNYSFHDRMSGLLLYVLEGKICLMNGTEAGTGDSLFINDLSELSLNVIKDCRLFLIETTF
ncbi:pirin family protein [Mucilaginibacter gynuensis]|uniref:Pirin family protein n=1 Tax=Mucilaginibacter gynuensis TaxID=1302236 RepID=A0ABP8G667_9SPHI